MLQIKWSQFALIRTAYQIASPCQKEIMMDLAKRAELDKYAFEKLTRFAVELVEMAERPRSAAAGANRK